MVADSNHTGGDGRIWSVLLGILILFTAVIFYARHVNIARVEEQTRTPVVARYTNYAYAINLRYPPEWQPVGGQQYDRYEGSDGFFSVSAGGTGDITIDKMAENEANHALKPYGTEPYIQKLTIDGQDARLILPSPDQSPSMHGQAVLIVKYPTLVTIGSQVYKYLVFWADRAHIQDIASSITFLNKLQ
ncbi:peptidase M56 [Candidatus Parcubacteria bacterium]|nr:peptidase M56 [Candidatus Parcubacteria bacterium]